MILFVTSLRHPDNSDDYARVEALLRDTLASITNQTDDDYMIVVVGNRTPSFDLPERALFVQCDYEPPARASGPHADRTGFVLDKGSKIGLGLIAARDAKPDYVMIFDADDYVHRDLVAFTRRSGGADGWVITRGWVYSGARGGYRKQDRFHRSCGTSYIVPFGAYRVPDHLSAHATQDEVITAYGDVLLNIIGAHKNAVEWHSMHGRTLTELPFRGAVYHVDTGENHSGRVFPGVLRPLDARLRRDFAITPPAHRLQLIASCFGPKAVAHSLTSLARRVGRRVSRHS